MTDWFEILLGISIIYQGWLLMIVFKSIKGDDYE